MKLIAIAMIAATLLGGCTAETGYRAIAYSMSPSIGARYDASTAEAEYQEYINTPPEQHGTIHAVSTTPGEWPTYTTINY